MESLKEIFLPDVPVLEIILRGTVTYLAIFVLLRVIVKQSAGALNLADLLLIVLIADAAQNAMAGEYNSVGDGVILVLTLAFWNLAIDFVSFHWQPFGNWTHPPPVKLIANGTLNRRNMRRELVSYEELMTHVRKAGGREIREVEAALVEGNGEISVLLRPGGPQSSEDETTRAAAG
ncbi:MAG: DUF421 domain-containing protein [Dehalococcoidia bacterium]